MTLAVFRVAPERQAAFARAWRTLCEAFLGLPGPPLGATTLMRSRRDPDVFESVCAWRSPEDVLAMREDVAVAALMAAMVALADHAQPGEFEVVDAVPAT